MDGKKLFVKKASPTDKQEPGWQLCFLQVISFKTADSVGWVFYSVSSLTHLDAHFLPTH